MVHDVSNPEVKELDDGLSPKKEDVIQFLILILKNHNCSSKFLNYATWVLPINKRILKLEENYAFMTHGLVKCNQGVESCYGWVP